MVRSVQVIELDLGEASVLAAHEGHLQAREVELPDTYRGEGVSTEALVSQERGKSHLKLAMRMAVVLAVG